jgi:hypothetical protein
MFTREDKNAVCHLLAEHIGNPAKRAARQRRNDALMVLLAQQHNHGTTTPEAEAEFAAADAELRRLLGEPPLPPAA